MRHFLTDSGTDFFVLLYIFCTGKSFRFFITLFFIIVYNRDRINFFFIVFLFGREIVLSAIAPFVIFSLKMFSVYFNFFLIARYLYLRF